MAQTTTNGSKTVKRGEVSGSDVADQIDAIKSDISRLTSLITTLSEQKGRDVRDRAMDAGEKARLAAYEKGGEIRSSAEDYYAQAEETVRRQPAAALGIAAGLGFIVGMMTARR